jgi:putative PEP-CTERM system TPR-repeat lipoprotein
MRKIFLIAIPVAALAVAAGAFVAFGPASDPVAAAKKRMLHGDMRGAALYLTQAVRANPKNAEAALLLGRADLTLNNPAAAQAEFLRARADGYDKAALVLPLGQAYIQQHHFAELLRDFDPDTAPPGARADTLSLRAGAQMALHDLDGAAKTASLAEALAPHDAQVQLTASRVALARGDLDSAQDHAERALAANPKPDEGARGDALLLQAEIALRRHDPATALARAKSVLATGPGRLDARLMEARSLAATGHETEARHDVEMVLHGAPRDVPANFLRAMLAIHDGDFAAADASFEQITPAIADLPRGEYFLAVTKFGLGQTAQAEEAEAQFLAQKPDDVNGLKLMAFIDLARHKPDRALAALQNPALGPTPDADTLDLRGRALAMQGKLVEARNDFAEATELQPQDVRILNRLAATELNLGQTAAGEADLKHSLEIAPKQRLAGEAIVQSALSRGDLEAAREGVEKLRQALGKQEGGDAEPVGVLDAQVKMAALDMAGAETELYALLKRFPDSRAATLSLVRVEGLKGNTAEAEGLLEAALRKHPTDLALLNTLLPAFYAGNEVDRAVKAAEVAHDAVPENADVTAALAGAYVRAKQPDRAVGLLDRASADRNPMLDFFRASILADEGKTVLAEAAFASILDRAPGDVRARAALARLKLKDRDFDGARATLRAGLAEVPGNPVLMGDLVAVDLKQYGQGGAGVKAALATAAGLRAVAANMPAAAELPGNIFEAVGDMPSAARVFAAAYKAAPSSAMAIRTATTYAKAGQAAQGIALLQNFVAGHKQDLSAQAVLSSLYLDTGQLDQAASLLQIVLATRPTDVTVLNNLAWIRQQQGDAAQARALAQRAYYQSPRPEVADTLGWILAQAGDANAALPLLKQAVQSSDPGARAEAEYHYAMALDAAGQHDDARTQVQSALAAKVVFREKDAAGRLLDKLK